MRQDNSANLLWFLAGLSVGTAAGLLLAPQSGADTRRRIGRRVGVARDYVSAHRQEAVDLGRELYEKGRHLADEAAEFFDEGRRLVDKADAEAAMEAGLP